MKRNFNISVLYLVGFISVVFGIALLINPNYPRLVFAGESSVATWMSGVLLVICGSLSLVLAGKRGRLPWLAIATFFFVLAIDERFMIHEYVKQRLVFAYADSSWFVREAAVITGSLIGGIVAFILWRQLSPVGQSLLSGAVILGTVSVVIDIADAGVLWEEFAKVLAEVLITTTLLTKISAPDIS
jgi:hypothetical protein